jgi:tetratricopeptide (TPR) repeat protein
VVALLTGGGVFAWTKLRNNANAIDPPMPGGIEEREIIWLFEQHQARIRANPASADLWGNYAKALLAHLFDRDADRCFAQAAELAPNDPCWSYGRAQIALKRNPQNAIVLLRQTIATTGPGAEYRTAATLTLAEALQERGEVDEAAKLFQEALGRPPGEPRAAYGLGLIAVGRGDEVVATRFFSTLLANPHARKQANANLARLARIRGDDAAAQKFEQDYIAVPDDTAWPDPLLDELATMAVGRRGRDRQIDELERAGLYPQALAQFLTQLETERTPKSLLGAGANYLRLKQYKEAMALVQEAVKLDPNSPHAQYTLALAYFIPAEREIIANPNSDSAKEALRNSIIHAKRATELKPDHGRAYLHWGAALNYLGDPKSAIEPLRKGVSVRPQDFDLQFTLAQALSATAQNAKDREEAATHFKNAQQIEPNNPRPAEALAKLFEKK